MEVASVYFMENEQASHAHNNNYRISYECEISLASALQDYNVRSSR